MTIQAVERLYTGTDGACGASAYTGTQNYLPIVLGGIIPLLHMPLPGLSPGSQSIGEKQRALQQGLADTEKRQILQKLTQIGGVQRYKDELQQALAGI